MRALDLGDTMVLDPSWLKVLLLPPAIFVVGAAASLVLPARWRRTMVTASAALLLLLTVPFVARGLAGLVATSVPYVPGSTGSEQAIVVLGGSLREDAVEYGRSDVGIDTLQRIRLAAHLQRRTGLPIVVSGGTAAAPGGPLPGGKVLADLMADALQDDYGVAVRWRERQSRNTLENAARTSEILAREGISRVILVTDALHMPRARRSFARVGLVGTPAPVDIPGPPDFELDDFIPRADFLVLSCSAVYEIAGRIWYELVWLVSGA